MKKVFILTALASTLFASCTKENVNKPEPEPGTSTETLAQQIIGKWVLTLFDGNAVPTNAKVVYTFTSETQGYLSASMLSTSSSEPTWANHAPSNITINGDSVIMRGALNKTTSYEAKLKVTSISGTMMLTESKYTVFRNGESVYVNYGTTQWTKVTRDYSRDILGKWEGRVTNNEGSEFDDGELHRWEYFADGSYIYYNLDADSNWVPQATELSEYFVDGTLLCTRWKNSGEGEVENREWWDIASIADGVMNWTALRKRESSDSTYTATFQMTKVQ